MQLNIFSFFSGAGFLDLGFENNKFNIVFVNEYNEAFLSVYKFARKKMNMVEPRYGYFCDDINKLQRGKQKKSFSALVEDARKKGLVGFIGGPPCPDFSIAGKNKGISGNNGRLTNSYKRVIITQNPDFFVFENVKGLWSTKKHKTEYQKIKKEFAKNGYVMIDRLVNAIEYGVPQDRERVILFGIKAHLINKDAKIAQTTLNDHFDWNVKYKIDDIKKYKWPLTNDFIENSELVMPKKILKKLTVQYWFDKNQVEQHNNKDDFFSPRAIKRFETIQEGDVSKKSFKRLHRWRYSPTAAYGNNEVHLHPYKTRRISVAEALAIQSLPKEYVIPKTLSKSDMFKTIGNGVPYLLAKGIAKSIYDFIDHYVKEQEN